MIIGIELKTLGSKVTGVISLQCSCCLICERADVVFTAEWQYGIDGCQSGGPRKGRQDPTAGRSQSGYPKRGTTLLGSSYLFTLGN